MRWCILALMVMSVSAFGQSRTTTRSATTKALHALFDTEWDYRMQQFPEQASELGDRRWNDRWTDESLDAYTHRHRHDQEVLARLARINRASLSRADQLNYDLFQKNYRMAVEGYKFHQFLIPLNQRGGIQTQDELADSLRFETLKDYRDWIARMSVFPVLMDQTIALMREGIKERMVHPRVIMERIPAQIDKQIVSDPTQSGFYKPFQHFSPEISTQDQNRLQQEAREAINQQVVPAYQKFRAFFVKEYLPACLIRLASGRFRMATNFMPMMSVATPQPISHQPRYMRSG